MKLPQIRLQSQQALISHTTINAKQKIQQPKAELDIQQRPAQMAIKRTPSKLTIDQTAAREAVNIKSIRKQMKDYADNGHREVLQGITRRVQQGDQLMKIENGENALALQAKQNGERSEKQFNIGFIPPFFSVKIHYKPTQIDIDWQINKVINSTKTNKPIFDYEAGKVEAGLRQKESLAITFVNVNFNA